MCVCVCVCEREIRGYLSWQILFKCNVNSKYKVHITLNNITMYSKEYVVFQTKPTHPSLRGQQG